MNSGPPRAEPYPWPEPRSGYREGIWIDHMILMCSRCLVPLRPKFIHGPITRRLMGIPVQGYEFCPECFSAQQCACDACESLLALSLM